MSKIFTELYCGLTNDHIVKEPISLSCGHCICKTQCLIDQNKIKCKICSVETDKSEIRVDRESAPIKRMIKSYLSELFEDLEKRATDEINSFKSLLENRQFTLDAHFKYLEEEIEIRIESIKNNLEGLFEKFKTDLIRIKKEMIEIQNDALNGKTETKEFEDHLKRLRDYIKNNQAKTEEKFYEHQENFKNINKMIENFQDTFYSCKLDLKLSKDQVDKKLIGEIMLGDLKVYKMKRVLINARIETIQLPSDCGVSLISLPNGNLVYGTYQKLFLLNENFQEIKRVSTCGMSCCALNQRNEIYVSDHSKHCIILFDLDLNQLNQFGSFGTENNQLNVPLGLSCHADFLYICDYYNRRIQILTLDFQYVITIQVDGNTPRRIEISETTIGVSCDSATLFYDLSTRALKYRYNYGSTYNINYIYSIFSVLNCEQKKFYFFDSDGNFVEEKAFHKKLILSNSWPSGTMCRHKDILYMTDYSSKIFKFLE